MPLEWLLVREIGLYQSLIRYLMLTNGQAWDSRSGLDSFQIISWGEDLVGRRKDVNHCL